MLDYIYNVSYDIKITLKYHFCRKNVIFFAIYAALLWTSYYFSKICLSMLWHGVISLTDATS